MTGGGYTLVICNRIDILTAEPYAAALAARGVPLRVACSAHIADAVRRRLPPQVGEPILLDDLAARSPAVRRAHNLLCILLEAEGPSRSIRKRFLQRLAGSSRKIRALLAVSRLFPKLPAPALNRLLGRTLGRFLDNPFPTRHVLAVSHVTTPHLLCARHLDVTTLNESWDHPGGKCAGYPSAVVIAWNRDVARDWVELQGAAEALVGVPVKLAYAYEAPPPQEPAPRRVAMYAVGTCATERDWYADELGLIDDICAATRDAGWDLLLKPRPAGPQHELPGFAQRYAHVRLGRPPQAEGTRDYYLDAEYNEARLREMRSCSLVINSITTFCLDAACAGLPVLQLDLRGDERFPALARAQGNYHLRRYLLADGADCLRPAPPQALATVLRDFLCRPDDRPVAFRDRLRSWIVPEVPSEQRVAAVAERLAERLTMAESRLRPTTGGP
jgi:hypothetical protein